MLVHLLNDWVLVRTDPMPQAIGSIIMPDSVGAQDTRTATVLQVGPGKELPDGSRHPLDVQVGDRVCFHRWNLEHKNGQAIGHVLEEMGQDIALIKEQDVLFVWPAGEEHTFW